MTHQKQVDSDLVLEMLIAHLVVFHGLSDDQAIKFLRDGLGDSEAIEFAERMTSSGQ